MRKFTYLLPAILISGCSLIDQPVIGQSNSAQSSYYNSGCQAQNCSPGQSYSVAPQTYNEHYEHNSQGQQAHQNYQSYDHNGYPQSAPAYVTPTGQTYGVQQGAYGAPVLRGTAGPNAPYGLRGRHKPAHFYGTLGGVMYDTDVNSFGIEGRLGYNSGRILGAEIEGSLGLTDDEQTISGVDLESKFDYNVAAFAVARLPLSERLSLHARGGYDFRQFSVSGTDNTGATQEAELDFDGFAYGIGGEYAVTPRDGLRLDYTRYDNEIGATDSFSASYVRKF